MSNNDPAFPVGESWIDAIGTSHSKGALKYGLTKLEWFAGELAPGMLAQEHWSNLDKFFPENFSRHVFDLAEAMLAESEKRNATK